MESEKDNLNNALVQKSRPLFSLWKEKEKINLFEYKMLDMYLSRINSHDPNNRTVSFSMDDMSEIISSHITKAEMLERLKKLQGIVVSYGDDAAVTLFEYSKIHIDDKHFEVELMCTQTAHKFFFNIERIGYFKYKFRNILAISSMYSYILFNYLEMNRFRNQPFEVDVDELKRILGCDNDYYSSFYRFSEKILKKCYIEINDKTELKFSYETVKKGRMVRAIKFNVFPSKLIEEIVKNPDEIYAAVTEIENSEKKPIEQNEVFVPENTFSKVDTDREEPSATDSADVMDERTSFFSDCFDNSFSTLQVQLILSSINHDMIEESAYGPDIAKYNYLDRMYKRLLIEEKERDIKNRFKYFVSMVKNDKVKGTTDKNTNESDNSKYDFIINKF